MSGARRSPTRKVHGDLELVIRTIDSMRDVCRGALDRLGIGQVTTRALADALDLDKMLAWKLRSLADAEDAGSAVRFIPGHRGWSGIAAAFEQRGHTDDAACLREAWNEMQAAMDRSHLSRSALKDLLDSSPVESAPRPMIEARSSLSDAFTTIWGVGEAALVSTWILAPAEEPDRLSAGRIKVHQGLHRTRPGPEWILRYARDLHRVADIPDKDRPEESDAPWCPVPCDDLLSETAEHEIARSPTDDGMVTFHGRGTSPGRPIDVLLADHACPVAYQHAREPGEFGSFGAGIRVPTRMLVCDMLIDTRLPWPATPEVVTTFHPEYLTNVPEIRQQQRMPMTETPGSPIMNPSHDDLALPDTLESVNKMYRSGLDRTLARMGVDLRTLVLHRLVVPSPVMETTVSFRWLLPTPPT